MPAEDKIHGAVKNALIKDQWNITAEPFTIEYEKFRVFADLRAERAEAQGKRIVVIEVKSFTHPSFVHELEGALGQYQVYKGLLGVVAPECQLYLAVPKRVHETSFQQPAVQLLIRLYQVALLVVDTKREEIVQWID